MEANQNMDLFYGHYLSFVVECYDCQVQFLVLALQLSCYVLSEILNFQEVVLSHAAWGVDQKRNFYPRTALKFTQQCCKKYQK